MQERNTKEEEVVLDPLRFIFRPNVQRLLDLLNPMHLLLYLNIKPHPAKHRGRGINCWTVPTCPL